MNDFECERHVSGDFRVVRIVTARSIDLAGENLLRELAPQVLGAVIRRWGDFAAAEDAVQEALLTAAMQWPDQGVPDNPRGWLIQVASRRTTDHIRRELSRRRRETKVVIEAPADEQIAPAPDESELAQFGSAFGTMGESGVEHDDTLICCSCAAIPR